LLAVHTQLHTLVVYYNRDKKATKISRFNDPAKAKKAAMDSLLIGMHAEIIATDIAYNEAQSLIYFHRKEISLNFPKKRPEPKPRPTKPVKVAVLRLTKGRPKAPPRIRTRQETNEYGTFTVNTTKARFIPV